MQLRDVSPTEDVHPALELERPFHGELRRRSGSVGGHRHFGDYRLDLDKERRGGKKNKS